MGYLTISRDVLASLRGSNSLSISTPCEIAKEATEGIAIAGPDARWEVLAAARWGPAIGDPEPGIVIEARPASGVGPGPENDAWLTCSIMAAGFVPIDPGSRGAPAWINDEDLAINPAAFRVTSGADHSTAPPIGSTRGRRRDSGHRPSDKTTLPDNFRLGDQG